MRRLTGPLALLVAGCLLAACGIQPGPVDLNGRPEGGAGNNSSKGAPALARPANIDDAIGLVSRFLEAAADDADTRETTLRSYLQPDEQWKPGSVINLVHILEITKPTLGGEVVRVKVQYVGELNARGIIEPTGRGQETIDFQIVDLPGRGLYLKAPRPELLFSDSGLRSYFDARPIFFWDETGSELVPDLRYVPSYLPEEEKGNRLVDFLYEGPASWLDVTVRTLPAPTKPLDRVVLGENKTIVVNLGTQPSPEEQVLLTKQLAKTLAVQQLSGLVLKVQGQVVGPVATPQLESTMSPNRYAVVKGVVHRLSVPSGPDNLNPVKLSAEDNKNVAAAAFSSSEGAVMLVHPDADGQRLSVGRTGAKLNAVALPGLTRPKRIAQPIWLNGETGLVLADERLFQVMIDGRAEEVASISKLTAFSVAPEGRRLALVVGNQLRMAALVHTGKGEVTIGQAQPTVPTLLSEVQSVAFGSATQLVAAGRDDVAVRVVPMNMDGAWQTPSRDQLERNLRIVHLVADGRSGNALYEVEGFGSYQYSFGGSEPLNDKVRTTPGGPSSGPLDVAKADVRAPSFEG